MSEVECRHCGGKEAVVFADCLASGWPVCCGETMVLKTQPSQEVVDRSDRLAERRAALERWAEFLERLDLAWYLVREVAEQARRESTDEIERLKALYVSTCASRDAWIKQCDAAEARVAEARREEAAECARIAEPVDEVLAEILRRRGSTP